MNRSYPDCLSCSSYIERGPRRCQHIYPSYYLFRTEYCPCINCMVKAICQDMRSIAYNGEERCQLFRDSIAKFVQDQIDEIIRSRSSLKR